MPLRNNLSCLLKKIKKGTGTTYESLERDSGYSRSLIKNALNGGDGVGLDSFDKLFTVMGYGVYMAPEPLEEGSCL